MKETKNIFNPKSKVIANIDRIIEFVDKGNTAPILVEIDPSNACNHACNFCLSSYIHFDSYKGTETFSRALMPKDMLLNLCRELIEMKVRAINWTGGGEPTLNKHLIKAIKYCGKHGMKMGMFTNGTLFDKYDMFEILVDYMTWIRISVDAGTEKTYNEVRIPKGEANWEKMMYNLTKLIKTKKARGRNLDIGVGFVISPDTYHEIIDFAKTFKDMDLTYCQYKPEIIIREKGGEQRDLDFWLNKVKPELDEAKAILGNKFQVNGYKLEDLAKERKNFGRNYKKCLGSQISPCIGADGNVFVCTNHRGWKEYSYGNLNDGKSFKEIWNDIENRQKIMHQIENIECFKNCTKLCKPHESNKAIWEIWENMSHLDKNNKNIYIDSLLKEKERILSNIIHPEFI